MEIKCVKSATRLLDRIWVNKGGLDLSKEVLWVSLGQRAAELWAVKVGGQKKILPIAPVRTRITCAGPFGRIFFKPPTLMAGSSAVLWPTKTHSTSLERSKPPLLTQTLFKSLAALLMYFISVQSTLISIGLISKGAVFVGPICRANMIIFTLELNYLEIITRWILINGLPYSQQVEGRSRPKVVTV